MMLPDRFSPRWNAPGRRGQAPHLSPSTDRAAAIGAGLSRALACPRFPEVRPAGLDAFQPSAGKPAPTVHGEPPQVRLTTGSWQQPVNRQQIYTRSPY